MARQFSIEDGNLSKQTTLVAGRNKSFSDIDLVFNARPNGDVYRKTDAAAVKQAVKNLLMTNSMEKPFSNMGGNLSDFLFELANDDIDLDVHDAVINAIENYEPRAEVIKIDVNPLIDRNEIKVAVTFIVKNINEVVTLETNITRLR